MSELFENHPLIPIMQSNIACGTVLKMKYIGEDTSETSFVCIKYLVLASANLGSQKYCIFVAEFNPVNGRFTTKNFRQTLISAYDFTDVAFEFDNWEE